MTERTTCAVIGGGPAGMVLGLLLARGGVEVTVIEKHTDFLRDFRGDTVHPSTLRLLDELGLGAKFASLPQSTLDTIGFPAADGDSEELTLADMTRLTRLGVRHPYIAMVPQWDLLDLLADAARAEPAFTLRMSTEVTGLLQEHGAVTGVRLREPDGTAAELRADLTVAADGRWSLARDGQRLPTIEYPVPFDAWWLRLPRPSDDDVATLTPAMRARNIAVVIPREGYHQIAYIGRKGTDDELRAAGIASLRERLADVLPSLADETGALTSMDEVKHLDVRLNRLRRWHRPGLLCIGDAAHAMSPIGGVGINLAVQDAVAAARLLAAPLRDRRVTTADLAKIQARRRLPTVVVQGVQRLIHRVVITAVLDGKRNGPPAPVRSLLRTMPQLSVLPAYLLGVGIRSEHTPDFAKP